ncbi:hypothetical protein [Nocardia sp. NPDC050710]|uniref:hypothetical protein n=1 Tax=Nocardia sp. NPDC050710 TaxID=3157220 RepID=UPI0033D0836E
MALAAVLAVGFEYEYNDETDEVRDCDFEIYEQFEAPDRTAWWYRLWTGNEHADGSEFRFFGTSGAGDYTGFWLVRPAVAIEQQPIIYLGSGARNPPNSSARSLCATPLDAKFRRRRSWKLRPPSSRTSPSTSTHSAGESAHCPRASTKPSFSMSAVVRRAG